MRNGLIGVMVLGLLYALFFWLVGEALDKEFKFQEAVVQRYK